MKADAIRSGRLRTLLQMATRGATIEELRKKCKMWGVTKQTENSYIETLLARIQRD
jgi:hypothetical protein